MKYWFHGGVFGLLASFTPAAVWTPHLDVPACEQSNRALLRSAQKDAESEFWLRVGVCLGDPHGNVSAGMAAAYVEWRDASTLALRVFQAREAACAMFGHVAYDPQIVATQFGPAINNPYAPVSHGRTLVRERVTAEGLERIETSMDPGFQVIDGVTCRCVRERETIDGVLVEDTKNWIAQDQAGTVWYFGELAMSFEDGMLDSLDGSWRAGVEGALPGILSPAVPQVGDRYRQEFWLGRAEDLARVVRLDETVVVPAGTFQHCLVIEEWDPLEPFEYLLTFIAPNVGLVLEVDQRTGERSELVDMHN